MASFFVEIDDILAPGIIATATLENKTPEQVVREYATSMATKICQDLKVGPYYVGPTPPQFNADGTPYGSEMAVEDITTSEVTPVEDITTSEEE
jgi:hypothetical protein